MSTASDSAQSLDVRITSATNVVWEGQARSVSSVNTTGPFDILPQHANFITLINDAPLTVVDCDNKAATYAFKQAVIYVTNNKVSIYADFD